MTNTHSEFFRNLDEALLRYEAEMWADILERENKSFWKRVWSWFGFYG